MPTKPTKEMIERGKKSLNPKDVLRVVIQETPELRDAMLAKGLVEEIKEK